jgi:hypothetical protein
MDFLILTFVGNIRVHTEFITDTWNLARSLCKEEEEKKPHTNKLNTNKK